MKCEKCGASNPKTAECCCGCGCSMQSKPAGRATKKKVVRRARTAAKRRTVKSKRA